MFADADLVLYSHHTNLSPVAVYWNPEMLFMNSEEHSRPPSQNRQLDAAISVWLLRLLESNFQPSYAQAYRSLLHVIGEILLK